MRRAKRIYLCPAEIRYQSPRYGKWVIVPKDFPSDGSTGGEDIWSDSWWVHDKLCKDTTWEDGTPLTNLQASFVIYDILVSERRWFRARTWFTMTALFGGRKIAKNNGRWRLRRTV